MDTQRYYTIGEFAQLCHTTKDTLIHYDQEGVFCPETTGSNGYRYYSAYQVEVFEVVRIFRELDMPLDEIGNYMRVRSPQNLVSLLHKQQELIKGKMQYLSWIEHALGVKEQEVRQAMETPAGEVFVRNMPVRYLMLSPRMTSYDEVTFIQAFSDLIMECEHHEIPLEYSLGAMRDLHAVQSGDYESYTHCYTRLIRRVAGCYRAKEGAYLCTYHAGNFDTVGPAYQRLLEGASSQGLQLEGPILEDSIFDLLCGRDYNDYKLLLNVRIKP